jgi:hypothetical protein
VGLSGARVAPQALFGLVFVDRPGKEEPPRPARKRARRDTLATEARRGRRCRRCRCGHHVRQPAGRTARV